MESNEYFEQERRAHFKELNKQIGDADEIYIDTCSLMSPYMPLLAANIIPVLERYGKKITIIKSVLRELKGMVENADTPDKLSRGLYSYMGLLTLRIFLAREKSAGLELPLLSYCPYEIEGKHADASFETILSVRSIDRKILVITEDKNLSAALSDLWQVSEAVKRKPISVYHISNMGFLTSGNDKHGSYQKLRQKKPILPQPRLKQSFPQVKTEQAKTVQESASEHLSETQSGTKAAKKEQFASNSPKKVQNQLQVTKKHDFESTLTAGKATQYVKNGALHVPPTYTAIAYVGLDDITAAYLPETITHLKSQAFRGCVRLTRVALPESLTNIDSSAFLGCVSLHTITIPSSIQKIDISTFKGCVKLRSVYMTDNLKRIESSAFYGCSELETITIPESVNYISRDAFSGCIRLKIRCVQGSVAHSFAKSQKIAFELI